MLCFSTSAVMMTIAFSTIAIAFIIVCFKCTSLLLTLDYPVVSIFILFIVLRLLFPIHFKFARPITLIPVLPTIVYSLNISLFDLGPLRISIGNILLLFWLIGSLSAITSLLHSLFRLQRLLDQPSMDVSNQSPYSEIMSRIAIPVRPKPRIQVMPIDTPPCISGLKYPRILIPSGLDLSDEDLYYILLHETYHCRYKDILIRYCFLFLSALYWWNPLVYSLYRLVCSLLEYRVDRAIVKKSHHPIKAYYTSILHIATQYPLLEENPGKTSDNNTSIPHLGNPDSIALRVKLAKYNDRKIFSRILQLLLLMGSCIVFLASYCFTFV